jgi:hypothetical protein
VPLDQIQPQLESPPAARLEIALLLFANIVGYFRLPMDQ